VLDGLDTASIEEFPARMADPPARPTTPLGVGIFSDRVWGEFSDPYQRLPQTVLSGVTPASQGCRSTDDRQ
jgi:hypothetical protein